MKTLRSKGRILTFSVDREMIIVAERTAYTSRGGTNRKWDESRVALSREELVRALAFLDGMTRDGVRNS